MSKSWCNALVDHFSIHCLFRVSFRSLSPSFVKDGTSLLREQASIFLSWYCCAVTSIQTMKFLTALCSSWVLFCEVMPAHEDIKRGIIVTWIVSYAGMHAVMTTNCRRMCMHGCADSCHCGVACGTGSQGSDLHSATSRKARCPRNGRRGEWHCKKTEEAPQEDRQAHEGHSDDVLCERWIDAAPFVVPIMTGTHL